MLALTFLLLLPLACKYPKQLSKAHPLQITQHLNRPHFRISTPTANYLLDSASGGLSSMIDRSGRDWIAYRREPWNTYPPSAASAYRGMPNLVFRSNFDGAGHPGHDRAACAISGTDRITCTTPGGPWAWTYTFLPNHVRLDVTQVSPTDAFWFLYEGPAGGTWRPATTSFASNVEPPAYPQLNHFGGQQIVRPRRWMYFGLDGVDETLFVAQVQADTLPDHYSLLGNDSIGLASPNGMVVAGFGRAPGSTPLLRTPTSFVFGFLGRSAATREAWLEVTPHIERLLIDQNPSRR